MFCVVLIENKRFSYQNEKATISDLRNPEGEMIAREILQHYNIFIETRSVHPTPKW